MYYRSVRLVACEIPAGVASAILPGSISCRSVFLHIWICLVQKDLQIKEKTLDYRPAWLANSACRGKTVVFVASRPSRMLVIVQFLPFFDTPFCCYVNEC